MLEPHVPWAVRRPGMQGVGPAFDAGRKSAESRAWDLSPVGCSLADEFGGWFLERTHNEDWRDWYISGKERGLLAGMVQFRVVPGKPVAAVRGLQALHPQRRLAFSAKCVLISP